MKDPRHRPTTIDAKADVAIALRYDGKRAPQISATGTHAVAEQIVAAAEAAGVPIYPDPQLAGLLAQIPLGDEIPEPLYVAVAQVIAFAYVLAGKCPADPTQAD